jgi:ankyrin repeat protein
LPPRYFSFPDHSPTQPLTTRPQLKCLEILVNDGNANLNVRDGQGQKIVHMYAMYADKNDTPDTLALLVKLGADLNAQDNDKATPLFRCAQHGDVEGVRLLLDLGASPDLVDCGGYTPLMTACWTMGKLYWWTGGLYWW